MNKTIKGFQLRRKKRMRIRMDADDDHGNTHLPYGIAESYGLNVKDKEPREVWEMLKRLYGISAKDCYDKLEKEGSLKGTEEKEHKAKVKTLSMIVPGLGEKREYRDLSFERRSIAGKDYPSWMIFGTYDEEMPFGLGSREKYDAVSSFYTKEDMLYFLKEHGVEEFQIGKETVNPQTVELPKFIGNYGSRRIKKIAINNSNGKFGIIATFLDGTEKSIGEEETLEKAKSTIKDKCRVSEKDIDISDGVREEEQKKDKWKKESDGSSIYDNGKVINNLAIVHVGKNVGIFGMASDGSVYSKLDMRSLREAVDFLKKQGVTKTLYGYSSIDPTTYKIPNITYRAPSGEECTEVRLGTTNDGKVRLYGILPSGMECLLDTQDKPDTTQKLDAILKPFGLSSSDKRLKIDDDITKPIKNEENRKRSILEHKKEKVENERIKRQSVEEASLSNPEYHLYGSHPYKDFQILIDGNRGKTYLYGTDPFGTTKCLETSIYHGEAEMEKSIDALKHKLKDAGNDIALKTADENSNFGEYTDESGKKRKLVAPPTVNDVFDNVLSHDVVMQFEDGNTVRKTFDTIEETTDFIKSLGANTYDRYISGGMTNSKVRDFIGREFKPYKRPAIRHVKLKHSGDEYVVIGDSDEHGNGHEFVKGNRRECDDWIEKNGIGEANVEYFVPVPNDDVKRTSKAKSLIGFDNRRRGAIEKTPIGVRSEQEKKKFTDMLTDIFAKGTYCMRCDPDVLEAIFDSHFKNLLETGTSGGSSDKGMRINLEKKLLGIPSLLSEVSAEDREKYGYLGDSRILEKPGDTAAGWYGSMNVIFKKDHVAERSTYSFGDSLDCGAPSLGYAGGSPTIEGMSPMKESYLDRFLSKYDSYKAGNLTVEDLIDTVSGYCQDGYIEIQFHDILTLKDVEQLQFTGSDELLKTFEGIGKEKASKMLKSFEEWGTKIVYEKDDEWADGIELIKNKLGI